MTSPDVERPRYGPFWRSGEGNVLTLPACRACDTVFWPPSERCPTCLSDEVSWADVPGDGTIWSAAEYHYAYDRGFAPELPYECILVDLDCGPRMISRFVPTSKAKAAPGQRVVAVHAELRPGRSLPCFTDGG